MNDNYGKTEKTNEPGNVVNTTQGKLTRATYLEAIDSLARELYRCLPNAGYTRSVLLHLETAAQDNIAWDRLPADVRMCFVRHAMGMVPRPPKEEKANTKAASQTDNKTEETGEKETVEASAHGE